jgi:co-chaperonin GroES (HSP10)
MTPSKNNILVKFDPVPTISGLITPERYKIQDGDADENTAYGVTTNRKLINPQVITILSGEHNGKRAFVYYGAYEIAKWPEPELAIIPEATILFFIEPIQPVSGTYLGEEVFTEGEKTASGIYITPFAEKKEGVLIKITHIPQENGIKYGDKHIQLGDTVVTVDSYQYDLRYQDKKYIKLRDTEIVGVKTDNGFIPVGDRVLLEYLPDEDLLERQAENEKRFQILETMSKRYLHLGDMPNGELPEHLRPVKEPNFTQAKLLAIGNEVKLAELIEPIGNIPISLIGNKIIKGKLEDTVMVFRYRGCLLPSGQWITSIDNVVGVMTM